MKTWLALLAVACTGGCVHDSPQFAADVVGTLLDLTLDAAFHSDSPPQADQGEDLPDTLDRDHAMLGMVDAIPDLERCAESTPITVTITVRPNGDLEHFEIAGSPAAQQCVYNAMGGVSWMRTVRGARFRYIIRSAPRPAGA
jgi:hypothetical protein